MELFSSLFRTWGMLARVWSAALRGVEGHLVGVELELRNGLPSFTTVGLPDHSIREARERVLSALRNSGFELPGRRVTVNLSPAQLRKGGSHFDLPMGLGLLKASGQLEGGDLEGVCALGELGLDGSVRSVPGVLAMAACARRKGLRAAVLPRDNAPEAAAAGLAAYGVSSLREAADLILGAYAAAPRTAPPAEAPEAIGEDLAEVRGQALAKRALEIAAAGGHSVLFVGPPGCGKSLLARRLPGLLPPLTREEALEASVVHSVCGLLPPEKALMSARPFRAPHHTASAAALVGGGDPCRPGEISVAHKGVLFLDELPEFSRDALEALRQPLEERRVRVARLREKVSYPADCLVIAAMNPCPCGFLGHSVRACRCGEAALRRYRGRVSGPLLDRMDLRLELAPVPFDQWAGEPRAEEGSAPVRDRVIRARERARARAGKILDNASIPAAELRKACRLDSAGWSFLEGWMRLASGSLRGLDRLLRVARTIADLAGAERVGREHLAEAAGYQKAWPA